MAPRPSAPVRAECYAELVGVAPTTGSIDDVRTKQSTGRPDFDGQIRNAITALKLPRAPADIAAQLAGNCKKIPYEFTWRGASKHGTVQ